MAIISLTIRDGQKPTEEQIRQIRDAATYPAEYDPDCPPSNEKALAEFAEMARSLRRKKNVKMPVTIRLSPDCLEAYRKLGKGYTGVMADVLAHAIRNPDDMTRFLSKETAGPER